MRPWGCRSECLAYYFDADTTTPTNAMSITVAPAMMPNQARTSPSFSGFLVISLIAKTPHRIAKGAGITSSESKPR